MRHPPPDVEKYVELWNDAQSQQHTNRMPSQMNETAISSLNQMDERNWTWSIVRQRSRVFVSLVMACALAILLGGREIPAALDDENYLIYATISSEVFQAKLHDSPLFELFFEEPVWLLLNALLANYFEAEGVVRLFIGGSALISLVSIARLVNWNVFACLMYFAFPMTLVPFVTHLRQGVAIAVMLFFLAFVSRRIVLGAVFAATIHSSFVPVAILIAADQSAFIKKSAAKISAWVAFICWAGLMVLAPLFLRDITGWLGDRRVDEYGFGIEQSATGLGFLLWLVFVTILYLGRRPLVTSSWRIAILVVTLYLGWYFFLEVGSRVLTSALIFVWLAGTGLKSNYRNAFLILWGIGGAYIWVNQFDKSTLYGF